MPLDIRPDHLKIAEEILEKHLPDREVWVFGSRVNGTAKETSDLDLVVIGETPLDFQTLGSLRDDFSESNIPYKVDVVDWAIISETFREIIRKDKVVIQKSIKNHWVSKKIGELGKVVTGKTPTTTDPENFGGPYPFITIPDLDGRHFIDCAQRTLSEKGAKALKNNMLPPYSVMLSCIATVGKTGITTRKSFTNQQINSVIPNENIVDSLFLYYLFTQLGHKLESRGGGGSVYANVSKSLFSNIEVNLPSNLSEQRAIAHILGTLDDKIELNRRMNETLEAMARALFRSWFVDFDPVRAKMEGRPTGLPKEIEDLFPDSFEDSELREIPKGWKASSVNNVATVIYGAPFSSEKFNIYRAGKPLIRIRDLPRENPEIWTTENHPKGFLVHSGDILVSMDGEFRSYVWGGEESWLNQRICAFIPKENFSKAFVINSIIEPLSRIESTEIATTVIHLGKNDIDKIMIIIPSREILLMFNKIAQPFYDSMVKYKLENQTLSKIRDILLPKLLSGEIRVTHLEKYWSELFNKSHP